MQLPQRLLQWSTLLFFALMIGGLVLYQCGIFKPSQSTSADDGKAVQRPWFDSVLFQRQFSQMEHRFLPSSKVGIVLDQQKVDTTEVLQILRMRYEVALLNQEDARNFQKIYFKIKTPEVFLEHMLQYPFEHQIKDSIDAWMLLKYHKDPVNRLTTEEKGRFSAILDSLKTDRIGQSRFDFMSNRRRNNPLLDTLQALKILKSERSPK